MSMKLGLMIDPRAEEYFIKIEILCTESGVVTEIKGCSSDIAISTTLRSAEGLITNIWGKEVAKKAGDQLAEMMRAKLQQIKST